MLDEWWKRGVDHGSKFCRYQFVHQLHSMEQLCNYYSSVGCNFSRHVTHIVNSSSGELWAQPRIIRVFFLRCGFCHIWHSKSMICKIPFWTSLWALFIFKVLFLLISQLTMAHTGGNNLFVFTPNTKQIFLQPHCIRSHGDVCIPDCKS